MTDTEPTEPTTETERRQSLRIGAQAYLDALDADQHRPGTPEDADRRDSALSALRAALRDKP